MNIDKVWTVYFSPTGNSKRVVTAIASGFAGVPAENIDLTSPDAVSGRQFGPRDLVVIGVPVYAGRVASLATTRLAAISGHNTPAVVVVTYGNREFEDALMEMKDLSVNAGFSPIGAGAFIGEHSFSSPEQPIASGRPDTLDLTTAKEFGERISKKLSEIKDLKPSLFPDVPGNRPYKDGMGNLPFTPSLLEEQCTRCELCLSACPTGAISLQAKIEIDPNLCIFCCSCIKTCPESALEIDAAPIKEKRQWLYEEFQKRKEPQLYW
jgi:ferredoxin